MTTPAPASPHPLSRPVTREGLFDFLTAHNIAYETHHHAPIFTVEEGAHIKAKMPGGHSKNLFLKDKAGQIFLICALGSTQIRLNALHKVIGSKRLSFGSEALLLETLGVTPGSVTLFALLNDEERRVQLILDAALMAHDTVNFHPLLNDATTAISSEDMLRFAKASGHEPRLIDFSKI